MFVCPELQTQDSVTLGRGEKDKLTVTLRIAA